MTAPETIKSIQTLLAVEADGIFGPKSRAALDSVIAAAKLPGPDGIHIGMASSFADPDDVRRFRACKAAGNSDIYCFGKGDNGKGFWDDDTTVDKPFCALPRDDWQHLGSKAPGTKVKVTIGETTVICELRDTLPWKRNIVGEEIIDLNPGAVRRFGLKPPIMKACRWEWA